MFGLLSVGVGALLPALVHASYLPESFPLADRATGVGLTFGIGSGAFGGLAPLVATQLAAQGQSGAIGLFPGGCAALAAVAVIWRAGAEGGLRS